MDSKPSRGRSPAGAAIRVRVYEKDQSIPAKQWGMNVSVLVYPTPCIPFIPAKPYGLNVSVLVYPTPSIPFIPARLYGLNVSVLV